MLCDDSRAHKVQNDNDDDRVNVAGELGRILAVDVVVLSIVVVTAKKFTELSPDWNIPVPNMRIMEKICCIK